MKSVPGLASRPRAPSHGLETRGVPKHGTMMNMDDTMHPPRAIRSRVDAPSGSPRDVVVPRDPRDHAPDGKSPGFPD